MVPVFCISFFFNTTSLVFKGLCIAIDSNLTQAGFKAR